LAKVGINGSEIGMIENIEGLCAKLQLQAVSDRKLFPDRHVYLPRAKSKYKITPRVTVA